MSLNYKLSDDLFTSNSPKEFDIPSTVAVHLPKDRYEVLKALEYCSLLDDNWNGFGARKPTNSAIESVKKFIESFPINKSAPDELSPDGEGGITLKWVNTNERLLLNFEPGLIHLAYEQKNSAPFFLHDITYLGEDNTVPPEIFFYIPTRGKR